MIEIRNLCKSYGKKIVYKGLDLDLPDKTISCIIGPSGCGKTTLLRILAGLETADEGEILGITHKRKAFVFQEDRLMPWLSVKENIEYVLASSCSKKQMDEKIEAILALLKLSEEANRPVQKLSGGMKRRVAIGRALVFESELLLLDEPFKGLDEVLKWHIIDQMLIYLKSAPRTVICVTHDQEVARYLGQVIDLENECSKNKNKVTSEKDRKER